MKITFIKTDEYETILLIKTLVGDFVCYADSVNIKSSGDFGKVEFYTIFTKNITKDFNEQSLINKTNLGNYSYKMTGKFLGDNRVLIDDCIFIIDGKIPGDIKANDYVSFEFLRVDAYIQ